MKISILSFVFAAVLLAAPEALAAKESKTVAEDLPEKSKQVLLHESVIVAGRMVRLGDFFANAGENADIPVAYSPEPGKRATFDANWLFRVAQAYKVNWRPLSVHEKTVVERESIVIRREEIEDHILAALVDKNTGVTADMVVEVSNRTLRLYVPGDAEATLSVDDIEYDRQSNRFTLNIAAPAGDPAAKSVRVTGKVFKVNDVPVLTRRVLTGEVIALKDIEWIKSRDGRLQSDTILSAEGLVGKAPVRSLRPGAPVRASDVRRPIMVTRGGLVTMVLRLPDMVLTAQGKAMDDGSDGDAVRVTNTQSNTVVEAVVTGAGTVTVRSTSSVAIN
ncbi:MAG: flagella basal body P-ring formation protein FlgA [Rhodospirillales bacterium RIFCSPLOWO2_12_FULL_58_28]|nr:MAG: flagella basal body P-ring formation protein FlgA [Rhodospirillales bacterium RIFCSPLOWO2_02_FULL_58_16]OHC79651.1 MAG: flagella basal body P-ring formation protein FlgA [Rhodospirillales bacterium RIFCSPLOWO2_12_FULL_58_28]